MTLKELIRSAKKAAKKHNTRWTLEGRNVRMRVGSYEYCPITAVAKLTGSIYPVYRFGQASKEIGLRAKATTVVRAADGDFGLNARERALRKQMLKAFGLKEKK